MPSFSWPWKKQQPSIAPREPMVPPVEERERPAASYYCTRDACSGSLDGFPLEKLAFGCLLPHTPIPFADLPAELQKREVQGLPCKCPTHPLNPLVPVCPEADCGAPVNAAAPIGLWAPTNSGKTVMCVALNTVMQGRELYKRTGVTANGDSTDFPTFGENGLMPTKTDHRKHHTVRYRLSRPEWAMPRRITLTDMGGENYQKLDADSATEDRRRRQALMLRTGEAIFLIDPETTEGFGALVDRDLLEPLNRLMGIYHDTRTLEGLQAPERADLLDLQKTILRAKHFPPGGADGNGSYRSLSRHLVDSTLRFVAEKTGAQVPPHVIKTQVEEIEKNLKDVARVTRVSAHDQLKALITFLERWGASKTRTGRLNIRLALTVAKSDTLRLELPDERTILGRVDKSAPWARWRSALDELSAANQAIFEHQEDALVTTALESFREVGFFFVSALGRPVEHLLSEQAGVFPYIARDASGARIAAPRGILWPVLWATGDAGR